MRPRRPRGKGRHSHSFPVWGLMASSFKSLTRDVWNVRQNQITTSDLAQGFDPFVSQLRTVLFWGSPSGGDDSWLLLWRFPVLSWMKGEIKWIEETLHQSLSFSPHTLPSSRQSYPPLAIFPTHDQLQCPMCQWGVIWLAVLGVFERSELHSLSSSTRGNRRRKVVRQEEKQESVRQIEKKWEFFCMQPLRFLAWEIVNVSCLVLV